MLFEISKIMYMTSITNAKVVMFSNIGISDSWAVSGPKVPGDRVYHS